MITVDQVKALRQKTGAGMYDCKKALIESDGIEELAIWYLRNYPAYVPLDWWRCKDGQAWIRRFEEEKSKYLSAKSSNIADGYKERIMNPKPEWVINRFINTCIAKALNVHGHCVDINNYKISIEDLKEIAEDTKEYFDRRIYE